MHQKPNTSVFKGLKLSLSKMLNGLFPLGCSDVEKGKVKG